MEVWSLGLEAEEDWIEEKNVFVRIALRVSKEWVRFPQSVD